MWAASGGRPCCLSVRRANSVRAQLVSSSVTCAESIPSALMNSTRSKPGTAAGGIDTATLLLGLTKTISADLIQLSLRLLLLAE